MKKKLIEAFKKMFGNKVEKAEKDVYINIYAEFQTKKGGLNINEAKKIVQGQALSQAGKHTTIIVVSGVDGYEKAIASLKVVKRKI